MTTTTGSVRAVTTHAGDPAWQVRGYDLVKQLLADPRLGRSHPEPDKASRYSESVIFGRPTPSTPTEREDHQRMRRLLTPSFSARRLAALRPRVETIVEMLLDEMCQQTPPVDFHAHVSFPLPAYVICELLGVPVEDREDFRRWSDDAADMNDESRSMAGLAALWTYMRKLVEQKRAQPGEDVISDIVHAEVAGKPVYTLDEAAMLAAGLLFAGHETTVAAIDKGVLLLVTNGAQRRTLQDDPGLVAGAVEEILRMRFPVSAYDTNAAIGLPRYANADIEVCGVRIKAGDLVLLDLQDANLDPRRFPEPCEFDISRRENPHLTFGHGRFYCIGAPLARLELQVLFGRLFQRLPRLRLATSPEHLRPRSHLLTGGLAELPVTW
jgi:pentalenolactone synthase